MERFTHPPRSSMLLVPLLLLVGAASVFAPALSLAAGTTASTLAVSATVGDGCSVNTSALSFGTYSNSLLTATGTVTMTCTSGDAATIGLDAGGNGGKFPGVTRAMVSGGKFLGYEIYQDSAYHTAWGNSGAGLVSATGTGTQQTFTAYGSIPAGQLTVPAGVYTDTVNITVTY